MLKTRVIIFLMVFIPLIGCATNNKKSLTKNEIENICKKKKLEASKPMTNISLGTGTEGPNYQIGISMSSDFITGRDPTEVYKDCKLSLG